MAAITDPTNTTSIRLSSHGPTYSYIHIPPTSVSQKPYLLFLHGFPDSAFGWRHQVSYFQERGYGLIVPDLLGYGGTDKPKEVEAYRLKKMAAEVVGILDAVGVKQVVGVGHDWGCFLLSRLANYYPHRFSKFVFIDVAYNAPMGHFSVYAVNEMTEKMLGYPIFGYWHFFNDADAGPMMDAKPDSMHSLLFPTDHTFTKDHMCHLGATRSYFQNGTTGPLASWITPSELSKWDQIFSPSNGGLSPPLCWYKAQIANLNTPDEDKISDEAKHIHQQTLLITCTHDAIAVPAIQEQGMRPFVKDLVIREFSSGHWVQAEKAAELNACLELFVS